MIRETANALMACVVTFMLCAVAYPASVYLVGHTLFPSRAEGSLIVRDSKVIGSELVAQPFASERYFSPRPSAAGPIGYAADAASGSNLATTNPALRDRIALEAARHIAAHTGDADLRTHLGRFDATQRQLKALKEVQEHSKSETATITRLEFESSSLLSQVLERSSHLGIDADNTVPVDLVMASGAGLDPHISPEAALYQAGRVARARNLPIDRVRGMIDENIDRTGAILGAPPRVNVLRLNLALDETAPVSALGPNHRR